MERSVACSLVHRNPLVNGDLLDDRKRVESSRPRIEKNFRNGLGYRPTAWRMPMAYAQCFHVLLLRARPLDAIGIAFELRAWTNGYC